MTTKAAAHRWLDANVGSDITTRQTRDNGLVWEPGPRTLDKRYGKGTWSLDGSEIRLTPDHVILDVRDDLLLIEWQDEDGCRIHVTAYRPVPVAGVDYETSVCPNCGLDEHTPDELAVCVDSCVGPRRDDY